LKKIRVRVRGIPSCVVLRSTEPTGMAVFRGGVACS
jgi:hypothetical protein